MRVLSSRAASSDANEGVLGETRDVDHPEKELERRMNREKEREGEREKIKKSL